MKYPHLADFRASLVFPKSHQNCDDHTSSFYALGANKLINIRSESKSEIFLMLPIFLVTIEPLLVLIEYVPYGDLLGFLRKSRGLNDTYFKDPDMKPQTNLTAEQLMKFAWQVADGMCYLSSKKVCFKCDLKKKS